jgi:acyl carrier protein
MTKDEIFAKVRDIIVGEFEVDAAAVTPGANLFTDLDLDSIDAVDLIVHLKPYLGGSTVDAQAFKTVRTVKDVVEAIYPLVS